MRVSTIAERHRGQKIWGFSQSSLRVWVHYAGFSTFGICGALTAHWIHCRASEGVSLSSKLGLYEKWKVGAGPFTFTRLRSLNIRELRSVAKSQWGWAHDKDNSYMNNVGAWLRERGVYPVPGLGDDSNIQIVNPGIQPLSMTDFLITSLDQLNDHYVIITVSGKVFGHFSAAHAVSLYIGPAGMAQQCTFFDPNHGEYCFNNKQDFFNFFREYYRRKILSNGFGSLGLSDRWRTHVYTL
ncbi:YopT-type cysteine protease domain-containing protein [Microbulbifer sp. SSSA008]|uniref:YopT-type cysteine protease domain-containing protein n=1 Tax=Microbulbifer sp. SSSA008 TaxID=3243380 RepID=UPI00403A4F79